MPSAREGALKARRITCFPWICAPTVRLSPRGGSDVSSQGDLVTADSPGTFVDGGVLASRTGGVNRAVHLLGVFKKWGLICPQGTQGSSRT